jgi:hypothetical protein
MLASILPGLRELRTPLATGYVFFLDLWLLLYRYIPRHGTSDFADALSRLVDLVGKGGLLAAISFACMSELEPWLS